MYSGWHGPLNVTGFNKKVFFAGTVRMDSFDEDMQAAFHASRKAYNSYDSKSKNITKLSVTFFMCNRWSRKMFFV